MDSPYDIKVLNEVKNYICTYGVAASSADVAVGIMKTVGDVELNNTSFSMR